MYFDIDFACISPTPYPILKKTVAMYKSFHYYFTKLLFQSDILNFIYKFAVFLFQTVSKRLFEIQ